MTNNKRRMIFAEWFVMKSIKKHGSAANDSEIEEDLMKMGFKKEEASEAISRLVLHEIIQLSQYDDYVFNPDVACSRLIKELSKRSLKKIPISVEEWEKCSWRRLAGLGLKKS